MDEIEQRLKESSETCIKCYEAWRKNEKDSEVREALQDAVHEIRKVASRLEIELAISERDEMAQKPIPIPPHRDARKRHHQNHNDDDDDNNIGNGEGGGGRSGRSGGQRRSGGRSGGGGRGRSGGGNPQKNQDQSGD